MKYDHIMFDLDGTLMDTSKGVLKSVQHTIDMLGLPTISQDLLKKFIGPPIEKSFEEYMGLSSGRAAEAAAIFRKVYPEMYLYEAEFYKNMEKLIADLKNAGAVISVATYKRESYTCKLLKHFNIYDTFDHVIGSDDAGKMTKTDIINKCISLSNVDRSKAVMIGDTKHDAASAQEAAVDFIAVTYGFGFKNDSDVNEYENIFVCDDVDSLNSFLMT